MAWQHHFNRQDPIKAQHIAIRLGHLKFPHTTYGIVQRLADIDAGRFKFGREFRGARHM